MHAFSRLGEKKDSSIEFIICFTVSWATDRKDMVRKVSGVQNTSFSQTSFHHFNVTRLPIQTNIQFNLNSQYQ